MHSAVHKTNSRKLLVLGILVAAVAIAYLFVDVSFSNERLFRYAMKIRIPKLMVMLVASAAIGGATIVFQTIIHNTIVTPCLLGMNSLYTLIHTAVVFFAGSGSFLAVNANVSFVVDLFLMSTTAVLVYSYLFKKTNYNVLYVLLIGTVLTSFFGSIQSTLTRIMDPNEYDSLLATLVASFNNVNSEIILAAVLVLAGIVFVLRKELALLDVLSLGRHQAINLGVDYDRAIRKLLLGVTLCIATRHSDGRTDFIPRTDHRKSVQTVFENIPAFAADHGICLLRDVCSGGRADDFGTDLCICDSGQCIYYSRRRRILFVSSVEEKEELEE